MPLYDLTTFLQLSSVINYNLSASSLNRHNILKLILAGKRLDTDQQKDLDQKKIVMEALNYLFAAYSEKRRRLGPLAVLHPLRATAMFTGVMETINLVDILSILFHDVPEDIVSNDFDSIKWQKMEEQIYDLFSRLDYQDEQTLIASLECLTKKTGESYFHYIWRLLNNYPENSKVVQIKLVDRLDNTLDLRIDLQDPLKGIDFYRIIFQILFERQFQGFKSDTAHTPTATINGSRRLYQLFKNVVLLSLVRKTGADRRNASIRILMTTIAKTSLQEAQRIFIHLITYHYTRVVEQRQLLLEVMEYCYSGKSCVVTPPDSKQMIDGLFVEYFGVSDKKRDQQLDILYQNKPLMLQAAIAFIVLFSTFLTDPRFYMTGISANGVSPAEFV